MLAISFFKLSELDALVSRSVIKYIKFNKKSSSNMRVIEIKKSSFQDVEWGHIVKLRWATDRR